MSIETQPASVCRFGTFEVDVRVGELRKKGVRIKLQEQPFLVLKVLLARHGEIVSREELRSQIWSAETFVDFDNSLNTAINKLREALGDSADNPRFIETVPRRGYRFITPIVVIEGDRTAIYRRAGMSKRGWEMVVWSVLAVGILVTGGFYWRSRQAPPLTEKDTIVLADFTNTTGDPVFDETLKQGLRVQLEQSPFLNILSDEKVSQQLPLMGRAKDERLTRDLARDLCQRLGHKAVLSGSIASLGTHFVIGLNVSDCRTGNGLVSQQIEANSREHVLRALGDAATALRKKLGESLSTIQKYDAPMEQVTTFSLEALQAYSLGMKVWHTRGDTAALPYFQRAAEVDPKFGMAYARMGTIYSNHGQALPSEENTRKAYALREKLSERERLYVETHYFEFVTGELERAASLFEVWERSYPRDETPHNNLAYLYANVFANYERAIEEAREVVRLWGDEDDYLVLSALYLRVNRLREAEAVLKQAEEHSLEGEGLLFCHYTLAFLKGDTVEAMDRLMSEKTGAETKNVPYDVVARGTAYRGRLARARDLFQRAATTDPAVTSAAKAGEASIEAYLGATREAQAHANAALRGRPDRYVQAEAALALAVSGDAERAEDFANKLDKSWPFDTDLRHHWLPMIRATVALQHHRPERALGLLRAVSSFDMVATGNMEPTYLRGWAYLMQGNTSAAATEFQKVIDNPGIVLQNPVGMLARLESARAYAQQGNSARALAAYNDFLTLWKDADPDIPILLKAKAEYGKLQ
jgi:eukaryotic-like serine/threonine-protein kinase